ncbi:DUF2460 domain-containing protein [Rhodoblastus sp.]|uniref:DUF2460 domain-containing protein n=1 Tax=Rhodoblastus sp. TaxID=1962975 RepID=UPI00261DC709|nr:DUF2460 domain-containing protein [Rhodoblastus sp.]
MSSPPILPVLPGQGWSVHKKPSFSTRVASHPSGREVRAGLYAHALYEFELTFNGLDSSGAFPGLQSQSLQTLMGFYLTAQGQLNSFLYLDPSDHTATSQGIGTGDGSTTTFSLGRALGGYYEPVSYALNPTAAQIVNFGNGTAPNYLPNNQIANSAFVGAVAGTPGTTPTGWAISADTTHGLTLEIVDTGTVAIGGQSVPYIDVRAYGTDTNSGGNLALNISAASVSATPGESFIASAYLALQAGTLPPAGVNATTLILYDGSAYHALKIVPNATLTQYFESVTPTYSGMTHVVWELWVYGPTTSGTAVDFTIRLAAPQLELVVPAAQTAPNPVMPTFGTPYYGAPQISVNGSVVNPSSYAFTAPNTLSFSTAPTSGAVIAWTGTYAFQCRFLDDQWDFENFMSGLWQNTSVKFRSIR